MLSQAAPAIGAGLVTGIGALELAKRMNLSPMTTAGILAAAGLAGTMLAPKGALQTMSISALGLGAGLAGLELWQDQGKNLPKPQPQAALPAPPRRQASYATREDVQDAVRAELAQHHQALAMQLAQMRDERNAPAWFGESDDERNADGYDDGDLDERNAPAWFGESDEERNADGDLDERNAPAWFGESDEERNADGGHYDDEQLSAV